MLYAGNPSLEQPILRRARLQSPEVGEARRVFAVLPPQHVRIGNRVIRSVPFVTPVQAVTNVPDREEDGLLATVLFQRVYISHGVIYRSEQYPLGQSCARCPSIGFRLYPIRDGTVRM